MMHDDLRCVHPSKGVPHPSVRPGGIVADRSDVVCRNVQPQPFALRVDDPLLVAPGYDTFASLQPCKPGWPYPTDHVDSVREACRLDLLSRYDVCGGTGSGCARGATGGEREGLGDEESCWNCAGHVAEREAMPTTR